LELQVPGHGRVSYQPAVGKIVEPPIESMEFDLGIYRGKGL